MPNRLIKESSLYLLQHAQNPVDWYPWGEEALLKAQTENKLLLISIGYSACHWCHVMEKESFEDPDVAEIMNNLFVCIKIDREERPDLDQIFMKACLITNNGNGGWPLNTFALPNGNPLKALTYLPKHLWKNELKFIADYWKKNEKVAIDFSQKVNDSIKYLTTQALNPPKIKDDSLDFLKNDLIIPFYAIRDQLDLVDGGWNGAPKFPVPETWIYILRIAFFFNEDTAEKAITTTLKNMANGGIFDHLAGGFCRYSIDSQWFVPHFEKMLYDNALITQLFIDAYSIKSNEEYKKIAIKNLEFIQNEMYSPEGGFYTSIDADSEGIEGKFYIWTDQELNEILGNDYKLFSKYYSCTSTGNWEHGYNILSRQFSDHKFIIHYKKTTKRSVPPDWKQIITESEKKLLENRNKRIRPVTDTKLIVAQNAMMSFAFVRASRIFKEHEYLQVAIKNIDLILSTSTENAPINHTIYLRENGEKITQPGFMDDYAFVIKTLLEIYQTNFNENYLQKAFELTLYVLDHFPDSDTNMFCYTPLDKITLGNKIYEIEDDVIPSSNCIMAGNLLTLGKIYSMLNWINKAKDMILTMLESIKKYGRSYSGWLNLLSRFTHTEFEVCLIGPDIQKLRIEWDEKCCYPNIIMAGTTTKSNIPILKNKDSIIENENLIYVCFDEQCHEPVRDINEAIQIISEKLSKK